MNIGLPEILVILALFFLLFGANKLPEIAKSFGKAFKEFKKEVKDISNEINDTEKNDEKKL
ncbi:MAG: hypothetical protein A2Y34_07515 [Spirochaetes bacterium GWC1_27_15]|nr:MAG: hypothetical protein A2Z98_02550 [Spirochaetes bacterium GWB1_27_13]OHD22606.1 MAG: hypothetical protein A2Y34_07515 [Spirochaetes bacterium GWC1_27_15]